MTLAITPAEFTAAATAWITAVSAVLGVLFGTGYIFWSKYGEQIKAFIIVVRHFNTQQGINAANIKLINEAPGTPVITLIPPVTTSPEVRAAIAAIAPTPSPSSPIYGIQSTIPTQPKS